jgi:hypothetical protein
VALLPGADQAIVPKDKLYDYALCAEHPEGAHKARVFSSALGIDREDWDYLRDQILTRLPTAQVSEVRMSGALGTQYGVPMLIDGLNGETHEIITAWNVDREGDPPLSLRPTSMSPEHDLHRLEVVELEAESGRWPVGTRGTIVELADSAALVEIADDRGHTLDLIAIPAHVLRPVRVHHQEHLAV